MLYHWTPGPDVSPPSDVEPRESGKSKLTQIAFTGTSLLIAILGYVAFLPIFRRFAG